MTDNNVHQLGWITHDIAEKFIKLWLHSERHAKTYLIKITGRTRDSYQQRERCDEFMQWFLTDPCAETLFDEVSDERGIPQKHTKEYAAWRFERDIRALDFIRGDLVSRIGSSLTGPRARRDAEKKVKQIDSDKIEMYRLIITLRGWITSDLVCACCGKRTGAVNPTLSPGLPVH